MRGLIGLSNPSARDHELVLDGKSVEFDVEVATGVSRKEPDAAQRPVSDILAGRRHPF